MSVIRLGQKISVILLLQFATLTFVIIVALLHLVIVISMSLFYMLVVRLVIVIGSYSCFRNHVNGIKSNKIVCKLIVHKVVKNIFVATSPVNS